MKPIQYIDIEQARLVLAELGIELTARQMKRAADKDCQGQRKLPFFLDPIDGRLKIEKNTLLKIYLRRQVDAENSWRNGGPSL
ncbi:MAG: hypothetical protein WBA42_13180 [Mesorhizobium sp.]